MGLRVGRYETLGAIASGGMAKVHLARAVGMAGFERLVAVKLMHAHLAEDPGFVAMFLDEARLAALIRHPNVVATIDVQNSDEGLFLVMEFVEGCSLTALLRKLEADQQSVPLDVAVRLLLDVLAGLQAAHEQVGSDGAPLQLVHRDVSPANVLVGKDGVARITDFGVARAEERISSTRGGELKGKVPYMPPEQLRGLAVDARVDVYAAGAVFWEVLVGRRLFTAPNEAALLNCILQGAQQSPRVLRPEVPEALDRICMRALQPDRDARYATAAELAEELENAAVEAGVGVATTRRVAKFVGGLGIVKTAQDVMEWAGGPLEEASRPSVESGRQIAIESASRSAKQRQAEGQAAPPPFPAEPPATRVEQTPASLPSAPGTSAAGALIAEPGGGAPARQRSRAWLLAGVLAVGVGGAVAFFFLGGAPWGGLGAGSAGETEPGGGGSTPTASAAVTTADDVPGDAAAPAEAGDDAGAGGAGSVAAAGAATGSSSPSTAAPPGRLPVSTPTRKPPSPGASGAPSARPSPTSFRPTTL